MTTGGCSVGVMANRSRVVGLTCAALVLARAGAGPSPAATSKTPCKPDVRHGVLPKWARTGFSAPRPRLPHSVARHGRIAALYFGFPLTAPPRKSVANKILWVSHVGQRPGEDLLIRAQRMRGRRLLGAPVHRRVEGGPARRASTSRAPGAGGCGCGGRGTRPPRRPLRAPLKPGNRLNATRFR